MQNDIRTKVDGDVKNTTNTEDLQRSSINFVLAA